MNRRETNLEIQDKFRDLFKLPFPSGAMPRSPHIDLRFTFEADCSLWNVVFEGFDEEADLTTVFTARNRRAQRVLHSFGGILKSKHEGCRVSLVAEGISIAKSMNIRDKAHVRDWVELMYSILGEMTEILRCTEKDIENVKKT